MLNKNIAIAFAVVLAVVCMAEATEEGPQNMAEALRMLQELDRIYTQAARPRATGPMGCTQFEVTDSKSHSSGNALVNLSFCVVSGVSRQR
ncbi:unnamed protein product [Arctia plantaginis]|uniref:Uncharacterized protein n=1 Tax=Arctia plantaginis TaxID=874455 RepID=A0A8S0ZUY6_ARCPL|nr:unnamed protein product [Arctia plantaginis]